MATSQFGDEVGSEMEIIVTPDDDFEAVGIFDDEPRLDHAREVNFSEADLRATRGRWIG
jgi:hypothetical protein